MDFLRSWLSGMIGAALFCALAEELTPRGPVRRVQKGLCGVVLAASFLLPLLRADLPELPLFLAQNREAAAAAAQGAVAAGEQLSRRSIEAQLAAYILDKARSLGAPADGAAVTVRWSTAGVWYPVAAEIDGPYDEALSDAIEGELGIAKADQTWRRDEGG